MGNNGHHGEAIIDEILSLSVPHGWVRTSISAVGDVRLGRQRSPKNRSADYPTKYLRAANITWAGLDLSDVLDMEFRPQEMESYRLEAGDVLLSEASGSASEVGKSAIWNDELENCCFQNTVIRFRPRYVNSKYALLVFQHFARNSIFAKVAKGVGIHHLSADRFASMPFLLPPEKEQARIVAKIEELFSDLDAGVAALARAKANLKRYRSAVLKAAVEGTLTEAWRAEHPNTEPASKLLQRILIERRKNWEADQLAKFAAAKKEPPKNWKVKYVEPSPPETNDLPELPLSWCWASVEQCAIEVTVGHVGPMKDEYVSDGIPFLRSQNVRPLRYDRDGLRFIPVEFHKDLKKSKLFGGELLVVRSGNIGDACVYPADEPEANCADLVITRLVKSVDAQYAATFVVSPLGKALVGGKRTGSALSHFNVGAMAKGPLPLPPMPEQAEIVRIVAEKLSQADTAEAELDHDLMRAARLRQSILKQAFEGKLVPQDPKDEPASVLLNRIKEVVECSVASTLPKKRTTSPRRQESASN